MAADIERTDLIGGTGISASNLKRLYSLFKQFSQDYKQKPDNISYVEWVKRCFEISMPELTGEEAVNYARETLKSIKTFNDSFRELNEAAAKGVNKETWFANNVSDSLKQVDINACGHYLSTLDEAVTLENARSLGEPVDAEKIISLTNKEDWNSITVRDVALHLGKNAVLTGLQTLTKTDEAEMFADVLADEESCIEREDILSGNQDISLKSAMTVALKAGVENKLLPFVPSNTSIDTLASISCMGIERMTALSKLVSGDYTVSQVIDHMEKASVVMFHNLCSQGAGEMVRIALSTIPVIGPLLGNVVGSILTAATDKKFREAVSMVAAKVKVAAASTVKTVWNSIKSTGQKIKNAIKNFCGFLFS